MPTIREKALAYLRDHRVRILDAITPEGELRPRDVRALVQGFNGRYEVTYTANVWSCSCSSAGCAHVAAVQLVTGWPTLAAKVPKGAAA